MVVPGMLVTMETTITETMLIVITEVDRIMERKRKKKNPSSSILFEPFSLLHLPKT